MENDSISGEGYFCYNNGDYYFGTFLNGKMDGYGTFYWKTGNKYEGYY
jgi:hypothetical protein